MRIIEPRAARPASEEAFPFDIPGRCGMEFASLRSIRALVLISVPFCLLTASWSPWFGWAAAAAPSACVAKLPGDVQTFLQETLPSWRIIELADLREDQRRIWVDNRSTQCPGVVSGRFLEGGQEAYAVLLHSRRDATSQEKVLVLQRRQGQVTSRAIDEWDDPPTGSRAVIWKLGPGKYASGDGSKEVRTRLDAVVVEFIPEGSVMYYWSGDRFRSLTLTE